MTKKFYLKPINHIDEVIKSCAKPRLVERLFSRTRGDHIEFISTDYLLSLANPAPKRHTNNLNGRTVNMSELWLEMLQQGMRDPLILRISAESKTIRLETGNQRVYLFKQRGITMIPTVLQIETTPVGSTANGFHLYDFNRVMVNQKSLKQAIRNNTRLCKPSKILMSA